MKKILRKYFLPIFAGAVLQHAIYHSLIFITHHINSLQNETTGNFPLGITPWYNVLLSVAPGFFAGALSQERPMLNGFFAAFIGQSTILFFYLGLADAGVITDQLMFSIRTGVFGLVSGAAGFMCVRTLTTQSR